MFGFQTVELRNMRANLIRLSQLAESSAHRTYQLGGRPDMLADEGPA